MKKIRFLLLLLVCSLSACASENEPINLFDDERDPQYLTNPIDSSISDISRSDLWRPLSSRNKKETFSQPTELASLVEAAGFADISQARLTMGICAITIGYKVVAR